MKLGDVDVVRQARSAARDVVEGRVRSSSYVRQGVVEVPLESRTSAGDVSGYNVTRSARFMPRVANKDLESMLQGTDQVHYAHMETLMSRLFEPGSKAWCEYLAIRVALRKQLSDGTGEYTIVRNTFPPYLPPSALHVKRTAGKVKIYQLAQFFSDGAVIQKYALSAAFIRDMQILAIDKPFDAACTIQEAVQAKSGSAIIRVNAGVYSDSKSRCVAVIRDAAQQVRALEPDIMARVMGDQMFVYGDTPKSEKTGKPWMVHGPVWRADVLRNIHILIMKAGVQEIGILYAFEMETLRIYVHDGDSYVSGKFVGNVGNGEDNEIPEDDLFARRHLTSEVFAGLQRVGENVLPVYRKGAQVASAVRVSSSMILVNQHVGNDGPCSVGGVELIGGSPIGRDLWGYNLHGFHEPWKVRNPVIGELVLLVLRSGDSIVKSAPFQVDKLDGSSILFKRVPGIGKGTSGAAIVAVGDGALLGLHSGIAGSYMMATQFTHVMMRDLMDWELDHKRASGQRVEFSDEILAQITRRGGHKAFISAMDCLRPVFNVDGVHVGTAMLKDSKLVSTVSSGEYRVGESGAVCTFEPYVGLYTVCEVSDQIADINPLLMRQPDNYERVVIIGVDKDGPYLTDETTVRQVTTGKRNFMVGSTEGNVFPLTGAIVVALQDGAVLGQYVSGQSSATVGKLFLCSTVIPGVAQAKDEVNVAAELKRLFPILNPAAWEDGVVDQIVTHPSLQKSYSCTSLARIGDSAARLCLLRNLWKINAIGSAQEYVEEHQSNAALAGVAWQTGLARLIKFQDGVRPSATSKAYADIVEAIIGAVWEYESYETFSLFLDGIGVVPDQSKLRQSVASGSYGLVRRPSEQVFNRQRALSGIEDEVLRTPVDW